MTTNGQQQDRWSDELARIAWQIEQLKTKADAEYRDLHSTVDTQFATLQNELRKLEAAVAAAGENAYGRRIAAQVAELTAKGDAAYALVLASLHKHDDATQTDAERPQAEADAPSGDAQSTMAQVDALRAKRDAQHQL